MEAPILMTDDQKRSYLKAKTEIFLEGLKKLEAETGMTIECGLQFTPLGIYPRIQVVPNDKKAPEKK